MCGRMLSAALELHARQEECDRRGDERRRDRLDELCRLASGAERLELRVEEAEERAEQAADHAEADKWDQLPRRRELLRSIDNLAVGSATCDRSGLSHNQRPRRANPTEGRPDRLAAGVARCTGVCQSALH